MQLKPSTEKEPNQLPNLVVVSMFLPVHVEHNPMPNYVSTRSKARKSFSLANSASIDATSILDKLKDVNASATAKSRRRGTISMLHDREETAHLTSKSFNKSNLSLIDENETNNKENRTKNSEFIIEAASAGNIGLHNAIKASKQQFKECVWVGTVGSNTDSLDEQLKETLKEELKTKHRCAPVFVTDSEFDGHYNKFCKQALWPMFHYIMPEYPKSLGFEDAVWQKCLEFNKKFATAIKEVYKEGDIIWINDYHLVLLCSMVRKILPKAKIGFFLHVPFPSSEVFRCLHVRNQILEGMLGADLIGFQTFSFARHFQNTCSRVLSVETSHRGIQLESRFVCIGIYPIGIDLQAFNTKRDHTDVKERIAKYKETHKDKKIVLGRDKLDHVKGVRCKIVAFEKFLTKYPEYVGKAILIQVALSTVEDRKMNNEITNLVTKINSKFGSLSYQPVVFLHQDISFREYLSLLTIADAFIITSLRDGMNLTSHEYVVCQEEKKGPLIMSEFAGTYGCFGTGTIRVNPWNHSEVADGIYKALSMKEEEKAMNWEALYQNVAFNSAQSWVKSFINAMNDIAFSVWHEKINSPLDINQTIQSYKKAKKRLLMFNFSGVLVPYTKSMVRGSAEINKERYDEMYALLEKYVKESENIVYIFSANQKEYLQEMFGNMEGLGLCAENGYHIKWHDSNEWNKYYENVDLGWKDSIKTILEFYTERTPGAYIEEKESALVWHYRSADNLPYASWQASECQNHIEDSTKSSFAIHVLHNNLSLEIKPTEVIKTSPIAQLLNREQTIQFMLYIGNDRSDEKVYEYIQSTLEPDPKLSNCSIYHCNVGFLSTQARYSLNSQYSVIELLSQMLH